MLFDVPGAEKRRRSGVCSSLRSNPHIEAGLWGKGKLTGISPDILREKASLFLKANLVHIEKGWHVDCDPVSAGVIVIDDWNCARANDQLVERRAWREIAHKYKLDFGDFDHQSLAV